MQKANVLLLLFLKPSFKETIKTDTGIASYFYMVRTKEGRVRRMETMASSEAQAQMFAEREVSTYKGKMLSKVKLARRYEWQRPQI
jgi:hypothetical protein